MNISSVNSNALNFIIDVPFNQYVSIGFGPDMDNVDMFIASAYSANPII